MDLGSFPDQTEPVRSGPDFQVQNAQTFRPQPSQLGPLPTQTVSPYPCPDAETCPRTASSASRAERGDQRRTDLDHPVLGVHYPDYPALRSVFLQLVTPWRMVQV